MIKDEAEADGLSNSMGRDGWPAYSLPIISDLNFDPPKNDLNPTLVTSTQKYVIQSWADLNLEWDPACEIKSKEALSAVNRATTQECKQSIANISCLTDSGKLYPAHLPSFCPLKG